MTIRLIICLIVCLASSMADPEKFSFERPVMGTKFTIVCYADDRATAAAAAQRAFAHAEKINAVASDYIPESELSQLSTKPVGKAIPLSPLLFELLNHARQLARTTDGAFDPTLGPLTSLWRKTRRDQQLPDPELLAAAQKISGWQHFTLNESPPTITMQHPKMAFDLGGIAKGYAADLMLSSLVNDGFSRSLVAAGGDIRLGDQPPDREGWHVALKTFNHNQPDEIRVLANVAVSTSGDLHQSVQIDGLTYSHILDPQTGLGLTKRMAATVIADHAKFSDPLATAACVLGAKNESSLAVIRRHPQVRELIIRRPDEQDEADQDEVPPAK